MPHVHYLVSITCYLGGLGGERWLHASPMATPLRSRPPPCLSGGWRRQEGTARPIGHLGISRQAIPGVTGGTESCCLPEYASIWRQSHPEVEKKAGQGGRTGSGQGACPADRATGQVGQPPCPAGQGGRQGGCPDPVRSDRGLSWHFGPPVRSHLKWLSGTKNSSTTLCGTWKIPPNT